MKIQKIITHCQICGYSLIEEKNKNDNNFVYAGFWRRFCALIIDNIRKSTKHNSLPAFTSKK
jgi:hypothetical protein